MKFDTFKTAGPQTPVESLTHRTGRAGQKLMGATKPTPQRVHSVAKEEISHLRADLDNFLSQISILSDKDLEQAKEKLMEKIAAMKGVAKDMTATGHKQIDSGLSRSKMMKSAAYVMLAGLGVKVLMDFFHCPSNCQSTTCCRKPRCWCKRHPDEDGKWVAGKCARQGCDDCKAIGQELTIRGENGECTNKDKEKTSTRWKWF